MALFLNYTTRESNVNFKQISFFSSTVFKGITFNILYGAVIVGVIYGGFHLIKLLNNFGVPYTDYFLENPKMILVIVFGSLGIYFIYTSIKKESKEFSILKKTISQKLGNRLYSINKRKDFLTKLDIIPEFKEYSFVNNSDISVRFYDNEYIDIIIKNVFANYFKLTVKDPTTVQFNLLNVEDETPDSEFVKKIFRTKPRVLEDGQINLVMVLIDTFDFFQSIKLNGRGFQLSIKMKFDNRNWKQIDDFLDEVENVVSILQKFKMYSKAV